MKNEITITLSLAVKLGSLAVHADEITTAKAHPLDKEAIRSLVDDPEVVAWINSMGAFLPVKR